MVTLIENVSLSPRIVRPAEGAVYVVGPENVRFVLTSEATGGAYALAEVRIDAPGFGPPYHVHDREDETFMVTEGSLIVTVDGIAHVLKPGDVAFAPRNVPHGFESGPEGVRFNLIVTGDNFERFYPRYADAIATGETHRLPGIAAEHGITLLVEK